jgi:hypothetical protein
MAIPLNLIQVWVGPKPPPPKVQKFMEDTKTMNSDMTYQRYGNEVLERYKTDPYILHMLGAREEWAFIVDRIRVLLLRDEGGIYIDCDAQPIRPLSSMKFWDAPHVDFVCGFRDPYRSGVALHRGISLLDNTFLASAKNGRMANRLVNLYHSQAPKRDGHDIGVEIMANCDWTTVFTNFRYVYGMRVDPETVFLHDPQNLGSWTNNHKLQFAT